LVVIEAAGPSPYTVTIDQSDVAKTVTINDTNVTLQDLAGGTLTIGSGSGILEVDAGTFKLAGGTLAAGSISIASAGTFISQGTYTLSENIVSNGLIETSGGTLNITGPITGAGKLQIDSGATLELGSATAENILFNNNVANIFGTLVLDHALTYSGQISNFFGTSSTHSDVIYLKDISFDSGTTWAFYSNGVNLGGTLTIFETANGITNAIDSIVFANGTYATANFKLASDGSGGMLIADPIADSGPITIDSGAVFEITSANSCSVTFHSATGVLILDHSTEFTGTIFGFSGDGTMTGSDLIDLRDISFSSLAQASYADGVLTVSDGLHTAHVTFDGSYQLANFKFVDDGQGGTTVYDPPVTSDTASATDGSTTSASADTITTDGATPLNDTVASFKSDIKSIAQSFSDQIRDILNTDHDGHGNAGGTVVTDALGETVAKSAQGADHSTTDAKPGLEAWNASTWAGSAHETVTGNGNHDSFVFKPNLGHDTTGVLSSASDSLSADHKLPDEVQHLLDNWHHDVATNTVLTPDANTVLHDLLKDQLTNQHNGFHFV
jgi:hypothetical protein